jgi:hypothetical protein
LQFNQSISGNFVTPIAKHDERRGELLNIEHKDDRDQLDEEYHGRGVSEGRQKLLLVDVVKSVAEFLVRGRCAAG